MQRIVPFVLATWLLLPAGAARSVDGVLEINQTCALNGCFAGDPAGFPVEITAAGSYRLTGNLVVPDSDTTAIEIGGFTAAVSVDLNGFRISGPNTCSGAPPVCTAPGGGIGIDASKNVGVVAIRNGAVHGMGDRAVLANNGNGSAIVESLMITQNGGTGIEAARNSMIRSNIVLSNGGSGIITGEMCSIRGNVVNNHEGDGISAGILCTVIENEVRSAGGTELLMAGASTGYASNIILGTVSGGTEIGSNICNGNTICP